MYTTPPPYTPLHSTGSHHTQIIRFPFLSADASFPSAGSHAQHDTADSCASSTPSTPPVPVFHSTTFPFPDPAATHRPSGLNVARDHAVWLRYAGLCSFCTGLKFMSSKI